MPTVTRRLSGQVTITTTASSAEIYMDNNWDLTKTFMIFSLSTTTNAGYYEATVVTGKLYQGSGTKYAKFERLSTGVYIDAVIEYQIFQMDEASVQHGSVSFTSSDTSKTATVTSVDTTKTFIIATSRCDVVSANPQHFLVTAEVTDATTLTFQRGTASGNCSVEFMCVTISDINTLQTKTGSIISSGSNQTDVTITSVDLTKTITFAHFRTTSGTFQSKHNREAHLTSATNLRIESYSNIASGTLYYVVFVVEFKAGTAYTGYTSQAFGDTATTASIGGTVDTTKTIGKLCGACSTWAEANATAQNSGDTPHRVTFTSTQITATRGKTGVAAYFAWEVMEFAPSSNPTIFDHAVNRGLGRGVLRGLA